MQLNCAREKLGVGLFIASFLCLSNPVYSWSALGHRLIAQIAYDQLTPQTKRIAYRYNHALDKGHKPRNWVNAAVWLDDLRYHRIDTFNRMHYIDWGFSVDGTPIPPVSKVNAVSGIEHAVAVLKKPDVSDFHKGIALRILLHVVGDIHQPFHATCRVSRHYPEGDKGGHFVILPHNPIARTLHVYWDNGAGYLMYPKGNKKRISLKKMAAQLEHEYPCSSLTLISTPEQWAKESHELGIAAYQWEYHHAIKDGYPLKVENIVKKRVALAGCRLGTLLNKLIV